ncbi:type II and III secretion system protein family protein [Nitrospinae bacterium AH_259_B05_G02_I21]|nr:type II and III secretion system protein family protein [Nitrospinae bacterium AH_259_B05_G02_I21]
MTPATSTTRNRRLPPSDTMEGSRGPGGIFLNRGPVAPRRTKLALSTLAALMLLGPASTHAQSLKLHKGTLLEERGAPKEIRVTVGKTKLMDSTDAIQRVSVTEPKVADVVIISPHQIIINGKKIGATNLIVWNKDGSNHVFDLLISPDVELVRRRLDELLPGSQVEVEADRDRLVIFGDVSNLQTMDQIITVVQPHAPNLINLMKVKSPQQVQLQVRIALVSRPALREAGISITGARQREDRFLFSAPGSNVTEFEPTTDTGSVPLGAISDEFRIPQSVGSAFGLAFQLADTALNKQASIGGFINLLETQGFAKTLAEPTLVALSGQTASFLSGGEEPVVSVSGVGSTDVEFKEFGTRLRFTPTVMGDETIWLKVAPEVSEVSGRTASDFPKFTTQRAETTIQLKDGQTFVIAGLLQDEISSTIQKVPFLGDIPIIGTLFRQVRHSRTETELIITVTARLVKPLGPDDVVPMPGDEAVYDPDDFELFLLGKLTHAELGKKTREQKEMKEYLKSGPAGYMGFIR